MSLSPRQPPYFFLKFGVHFWHFADTTILLAGLVIYGVVLWWWDQTPHVVTVICLVPRPVALVFFYRASSRSAGYFLGRCLWGRWCCCYGKGPPLFLVHHHR